MCIIRSRTLLRRKFLTKRPVIILLLSICFSVLLTLEIFSQWKLLKTNVTLFSRGPAVNETLAYQCCTPTNKSIRTNIFFLKTHKTGGTTVQSVLMRFAIMNSLDILKVNYASYYLPFSDSSIPSQLMTPNNKYNVFADHARYDPKIKQYQYPDTSMVTLLRHPIKLFQSLYVFYQMDKTMGMTFQQFLNAPVKPPVLTGYNSDIVYRGYNQMSVDLGFDWTQSENTTAVAEFIAKIDREFDFVMITEYMDESFVLLANLMGWPLEYVASLKLNARLPELDPYILTSRDELTILDLNQIDTQLYNHFLAKFLKCKRQYGEDNLSRQVQQLRIINENFKQRCVAEEVTGSNIGNVERLEYVPRNQSDMECFSSMQLLIGKTIRKIQAEKLQHNFINFIFGNKTNFSSKN
ncbi:galactosylceramide sulfotransferase-like [Planococcus citri]|uniref:galactosylceramide sulfotransferase-like n=1 Tax=Planococcus citri TaxID=170843 RepID=UPI0031FA11FA